MRLKAVEACYKVKTTKDLSIFKSISANRPVVRAHVAKLVASMTNKVLFAPVYVTKDMEILDGQHRVAAMRKLQEKGVNITASYIVLDYLATDNVLAKFNTNTIPWNFKTFVSHHIKRGSKSSELFSEFQKYAHGMSYGTAAFIITGKDSAADVKLNRVAINKEDLEIAKNFYDNLLDFKQLGLPFWRNIQFVKAFYKIYCEAGYSHEETLRLMATERKVMIAALPMRNKVGDFEVDLRKALKRVK